MRRILATLFTGVLLSGCVDTYTVRQITPPSAKLQAASSFYVSVPADGKFNRTTYTGSGKKAAEVIGAALKKHAPTVTVAPYSQTREEAVDSARKAHAAYLVWPMIVHWEDRATGWSGRPDVVEMSIEVIDLASGSVAASSSIGGKSRWGTVTDDKPEDLLPEPVNGYIATLF